MDWAKEFNLRVKTLTARLDRGWSFEKALEAPIEHHATPEEMAERHAALYAICEEQKPITVRGVFYQAEVNLPQWYSKDSYGTVKADLVKMRKGLYQGPRLPYDWIVDNTRRVIKPNAFDDVSDALLALARAYNVDLWSKDKMNCLVQVWLEKDALSNVLEPVTRDYGVPLMVARGYSSLSFLNEQAALIEDEDRPVFIYLLGDADTYGEDAHDNIEEQLREMAPNVDFTFERLAVTKDQIRDWKLPKRLTDQTKKRNEDYGKTATELDAISPVRLRQLVEDAINKHMTKAKRNKLRKNEERDRNRIMDLARAN